MDDLGTELRDAIVKSRHGKVRWRCPANLRNEVVSYVASRRDSGSSVMEIAADLGVSDSTLTRWMTAEKNKKGSMSAVRVKETAMSSGVVLVTPRGYRIEGLDVASAAHLLRSL